MARAPALDWGWKTSPAVDAALVAGGAYSVAAVGALSAMPATQALTVGGIGAAAQAAADLYQRRPGWHITARCAAWLTAGGWTAQALADHTALTWQAAGWWAAGTAAGITLARGLARTENAAREQRTSRRLQVWANTRAREWHERLERLFRLEGHTVEGVMPWKSNAGYTVRVAMPSTTPQLPADAVRKLATDLKLPRGGGIQITDGLVYGEIHIRVTIKDVMSEDLPLPDSPEDLTVTSTYGGLPLGLQPDAQEARIGVVDDCALFVGQVGSGKTNVVNVANAGALRTNDTVVMHIDVTGAGISLPWLRAWAVDGTSEVPLIDYVGDTEEEAHILCDFLIAGIGARKSGHQDLLSGEDDKLTVGPDLPEVLLVVDEIAELSPRLLAKLDTIVNTGRAVRVRVIICGLRATQDVITAAMKKQSRVRVGMRVSDPEELSHLFPTGAARLDPKAAPGRGCGFFSAPDAEDIISDPAPYKAYRITPKVIQRLAAAYGGRRPRLEAEFLDTAPARYYASRWGRVLPRLYKSKTLAPTTVPYTDMEILRPPLDEVTGIPDTGAETDEGAGGDGASSKPGTPGRRTASGGVPAGKRFGSDALTALLNSPRTPSGPQGEATGEDRTVIHAQFGRVVAQTGGPADRPDPVPRLLLDAHQAVTEAGGRLHTGDLSTRLGLDAVALGKELSQILKTVGVERPGIGSVRIGEVSKSGYLAATLAEAITRYRNTQ
ncbi:hypothetical protein IPZ58_23370 [Streptomyces roseoverticillatus]|uniref:hypothetical protein n=1 Tax=Streptomyces roseoverticillatus TaxID=66429 RepID=UPI001F242B37|nr:hypothetical protein [Streptomyces roseoverticillatus]MCF3104511.1 hypothetical protein [Streptomyces roseoverticillatus]